jgi:ABC-type Zn uptake system ZnuABC Zn-binding protein ZnuA
MRMPTAIAMLLASALLAHASDSDGSQYKGRYEIWEDFEGGTVCPLVLEDEMSIGGFALQGDDGCMAVFELDGDPHAWFVDAEGWIVLIDATRQILSRFEPQEDGTFYANRTADRRTSLNLSPVP